VKGTGSFPFLIFLWLLSFHQGKESDKMTIKQRGFLLKVVPDLGYQSGDALESNPPRLFDDISILKMCTHGSSYTLSFYGSYLSPDSRELRRRDTSLSEPLSSSVATNCLFTMSSCGS